MGLCEPCDTTRERLFIALVPLSMYAFGATIGNGQFGVHLAPLLLAAILGLQRPGITWRGDLRAA